MVKRGYTDIEKAETTFLYEYRKGMIGKTYLEIEYERKETI